MAKIVVECSDPNDLDAIEKATEEFTGRCNITYFRQHEALIKADKSRSKAESARIISNDTGESIESVRSRIRRGEKEIGHADQLIPSNIEKDLENEKRKSKDNKSHKKYSAPVKSVFNETNENIKWARWTWNPVTGCKHECPYCYARDIANRFFKEKFKPTFHKNRLSAPQNTQFPDDKNFNVKFTKEGNKTVFVCSMADLFGDWVPKEWIQSVIDAINESPQWTYLFLTKNPKRYLEFEWPSFSWLGVTADTQKRADEAIEIFQELKTFGGIRFLSCEPLEGKIVLTDSHSIDWLIIGGRSQSSGMPAGQPEWEWVESLICQARQAGIKKFMKPNLTVKAQEYPG